MCELLELPIIVLLVAVSKLTSTSIYFPSATIKYKNFCNLLYSIEDRLGIDVAVDRLHYGKKVAISCAFKMLLELLFGSDASKHNPISIIKDQLLSSSNDKKIETFAEEQLQCERLLILYLLILSNIPKGILGGKMIVDAFRNHIVTGRGKLLQVFNKIQDLRNQSQAKTLLSDFLKTRNDRLVEYNFRRDCKLRCTKRLNKVPNNIPGSEWKIMSRKAMVDEPSKTQELTKGVREDISQKSRQYPGYLDKEEVGNEDKTVHEENEDKLSFDLSDNINEHPLNEAEFSDWNEAEFVESSNLLDDYAALDFNGPNVSERDDLNEDLDENFNKAKMEREQKINESVKATCIQKWWKKMYNKRRAVIKRNNSAASKIQLWWKRVFLKMQEIKNAPSPSIPATHVSCFDSQDVCIACNIYIYSKEDHLTKSKHREMTELHERFQMVSKSILQLNESFDEYCESICHNKMSEDEKTRTTIMVKYGSAKKMRRWSDSQELELLISSLMRKINGGKIIILFVAVVRST